MRNYLQSDASAGRLLVHGRGSKKPTWSGRGFTVVEVLIAAALLLAIALGLLPLYIRGIISNVEGFDHTQVANAARTRGEEFYQLPFNSEPLTLLAGTERIYDEYFSEQTRAWLPGTVPVGEAALFTRTTTIRQFNVNDLATPLDNVATPATVHLKEIVVTVQSTRSGLLGMGKRITIRTYKSQ